ncbi:MAG: bifunctional precorrin-2 dehydrogenase/sirohydrochlorin ferrochelatase [Blastocatellales bacterium]
MMRYYPIFLDLKDRRVLVVGGGVIAEGKARQLIDAGARVSVVSLTLTEPMTRWNQRGEIEWREGVFAENDLDGVWLVISATDDRAVNSEVARASAERGLLCNVVDQTEFCNFITPALITRGRLQIAVSSSGGSPSVAQRVKREIGQLIGDEYSTLLEIAAEIRPEAKRLIPNFEHRRQLLHEFAESEAIDLLRDGKYDEARQLAFDLLQKAVQRLNRYEGDEKS